MAQDVEQTGLTPEEQPGQKPAGRARNTDDSFIGRAGQFAVLAELMRLRCNAAVPEVDLGTDVLVFRDGRPEVARLQVKACTTPREYADGSGYSAKFGLPMKQFESTDDEPPLYYVLAIWRTEKWGDYLVVSRSELQAHYASEGRQFGHTNRKSGDLEITVEFRGKVECSGRDLTACRNAWSSLPPLQPRA
jgi:hypothetical protein